MDGSVSIKVKLKVDKSELEAIEKESLNKKIQLDVDDKEIRKIEDKKITFMGYLDSSAIEKEIERLENRGLKLGGSGGVSGSVGGTDCCEQIVAAIEQLQGQIATSLSMVQNGITNAVNSSSTEQSRSREEIFSKGQKSQVGRDLMGFISSPLRSITRGVFEGFGQGLSASFTGQFVSNLEKELGDVFKKVGQEFGSYVGREVDKATGLGGHGKGKKPRTVDPIVTPPPPQSDPTPPRDSEGEGGMGVSPSPFPKQPSGGEGGVKITPEQTRSSVDDIAASRQFFQKSNKDIGRAKSVIRRKEFNKPVSDKEIEATLETLRKGKLYARKVSAWLDTTIAQLDDQLAQMPKKQRFGSEPARLKAQLVKTKQSIQDFERLTRDADKVGLGKAVSEGVRKGVDKRQAYATGKELGSSVEKGFKDQTGIASPAKKFIQYMQDIAKGVNLGVTKQAQSIYSAGKKIGEILGSGFSKTLKTTNRAFTDFNGAKWFAPQSSPRQDFLPTKIQSGKTTLQNKDFLPTKIQSGKTTLQNKDFPQVDYDKIQSQLKSIILNHNKFLKSSQAVILRLNQNRVRLIREGNDKGADAFEVEMLAVKHSQKQAQKRLKILKQLLNINKSTEEKISALNVQRVKAFENPAQLRIVEQAIERQKKVQERIQNKINQLLKKTYREIERGLTETETSIKTSIQPPRTTIQRRLITPDTGRTSYEVNLGRQPLTGRINPAVARQVQPLTNAGAIVFVQGQQKEKDPNWRFYKTPPLTAGSYQRPRVRPSNPFVDFSAQAIFDFQGKQKQKKKQFVEETQELINERKKREQQADEQVRKGYKNLFKQPIQAVKDIFKGTRDRNQAKKEINRLERQFSNDASSVFDRIFRVIGVQIKRKAMKNMTPEEKKDWIANRGQAIREASGFMLAGVTFLDVMAPVKLALAPLAMAMSPLLITLAGLNRVLGPLVVQFVETLKIIEPIQRRFAAIAGSAVQGNSEYEFARDVATDYNVPVQSALDQYSRLLGAAKGTALEGQGLKDLFEGLAIATKSMGLSAQDAELVFYAFNNMVAKGKIQSEELRLQLAEKFPPAIGIFSRAMGVSQAELFDLVEKGALLSEDVLPKVAKQLKSEFGGDSVSGIQQFIDGLTRIQNALFRTQEQLAKTFQPVLAIVGGLMAKVAEIFESQIPVITQLGSVFAIGFGAQFLVGLQQIFSHGKIAKGLATVQVLLIKAFAGAMQFLSPFLIGIIADMMDNVLGADNSVFENLTATFKNITVAIVYLVDSMGTAIAGSYTWFDQLTHALTNVLGVMVKIIQILPSGVVELIALTFILVQISALTNLYVIPAFTKFTLVFGEMLESIKVAIASKQGLKGIWATLTGGINAAKFALAGFVGLLFLMIAKSDLINELWLPLKKNNKELIDSLNGITNAINEIENAVKGVKKELGNIKIELPSKGLELNPLVLISPSWSFKTDDLTKRYRDSLNNQEKDPKLENQLKELGINDFVNAPVPNLLTTAELQLIQNAEMLKEYSQQAIKILENNNLTSDKITQFLTPDKQAIVNTLKEIDEELLALGKERTEMGLINTSEAKKRIGEIDQEILSLRKKREGEAKPLIPIVENALQAKQSMDKQIEEIKKSSYSDAVKKALLAQLKPGIEAVSEAYDLLDQEGIIDIIEPLASKWKEVTNAIADANLEYEKWVKANNINNLNDQTNIIQQRFTPEEEAKKLGDLELTNKDAQLNYLEEITTQRKDALTQLLAIPAKSNDQKQQIKELRDSVAQGELEIAQTRLNIAQKTAEQRKKIEADMLADLTRANKEALYAIEEYTGQRVIEILEDQYNYDISPQSADFLISQAESDAAIATAQQTLGALERELLEYQKMRAMSEEDYQRNVGKPMSEAEIALYAEKNDEKLLTEQEFVEKSIEINKKLLTTKKDLIQEELNARKAANEERLRVIQEEAIANKTMIGERLRRGNLAKETRGEGLKGDAKNLNYAEQAIILQDIIATQKSIEAIGNSDPLKLRELNKQLNELRNRLIAVIEAQKIARLEAEKHEQIMLSLTAKRVDLEPERALIAAEAEKKYNEELLEVKKQSLAEYDKLNLSGMLSDSDYAQKRRQLLGEIRQLEQQNIEALIGLEKARIDAMVANLERELKYRTDLQDIRGKEIEQLIELKQAINDLQSANSDLRISGGENQLSLIEKALNNMGEKGQKAIDDYEEKQSINYRKRLNQLLGFSSTDPIRLLKERDKIEQKIAQEKMDAMEREMQLQREMLQLEQEQAIAAKQRAIEEAQINKIKAEQLVLIAQKTALEAKSPEEKAIAAKGLEIANRGLEIADKQVNISQKALENEIEISNRKRESLQITQTQQVRDLGIQEVLKNPKSLPGFKTGYQANGLPFFPLDEFAVRSLVPKATDPTKVLNTILSQPLPSFRGSGMLVNRRPLVDNITPNYQPNMINSPQLDMNAIIMSQERMIREIMKRPTIEKVEVNNQFADANNENTFENYRTQTIRDFNDILEKRANL